MAGKSNYLENHMLGWIRGTAMPAAPSAVYVSLHNGDPTDAASGGTDVTTTIRPGGRVAVTFGTVTTNAGANTIANTGIVDFGNAAGPASVTHFGVWDAASGGNPLYFGNVTGAPVAVANGAATSFAIGQLVLSED